MQLGALTRTYIPLFSHFHAILSSLLFFQHAKPSMEKTLELELLLRMQPKQLGTRAAYDAAYPIVKYLLVAWLAPWWSNIGFPEMTLSATVHLRKLGKTCKNVKTAKWLKEIVDKVEQTAAACRVARDTVDFTPSNLAACREWEAAGWGRGQSSASVPLTQLLMQYKKERDAQRTLVLAQYTRSADDAKEKEEPGKKRSSKQSSNATRRAPAHQTTKKMKKNHKNQNLKKSIK